MIPSPGWWRLYFSRNILGPIWIFRIFSVQYIDLQYGHWHEIIQTQLGLNSFFLQETKSSIRMENWQWSCFKNVELQPILTQISDTGLTDDELEYNICIKKYSATGEGGKLMRVK